MGSALTSILTFQTDLFILTRYETPCICPMLTLYRPPIDRSLKSSLSLVMILGSSFLHRSEEQTLSILGALLNANRCQWSTNSSPFSYITLLFFFLGVFHYFFLSFSAFLHYVFSSDASTIVPGFNLVSLSVCCCCIHLGIKG